MNALERINSIESRFHNLFGKGDSRFNSEAGFDPVGTVSENNSFQTELLSAQSEIQKSSLNSLAFGGGESTLGANNIQSSLQSSLTAQIQERLKREVFNSAEKVNQNTTTFSTKIDSDIKNVDKSSQQTSSSQTSSLIRDKETIKSIIEKAAEDHNLPKAFVMAVAKAESNFDQNAVSNKGAMGIMQLMPLTAKNLGVENPFSPRENIYGGTKLLRQLMNTYQDDLVMVLAAYNAGEKVVNEKGFPNYKETHEYVKRVLDNYMRYSGVKEK